MSFGNHPTINQLAIYMFYKQKSRTSPFAKLAFNSLYTFNQSILVLKHMLDARLPVNTILVIMMLIQPTLYRVLNILNSQCHWSSFFSSSLIIYGFQTGLLDQNLALMVYVLDHLVAF